VPKGPYAIADLGNDLIALLDRLNVGRASVLGNSLGGMVGMWMAAMTPHRIERLALLCTSAHLGSPEAWRERAETVRRHGTSAVAEAVAARWTTRGFALREPAVVSSMRAMIASNPAEGYAACCEAIADWNFEKNLGAVRAPTLVVAGGADDATPPSHAHRIGACIPTARVVIVDDAAHVPVIEHPDRIGEVVLAHLGPTASSKGPQHEKEAHR
jgi:3-oxoadipate enol-lactonase